MALNLSVGITFGTAARKDGTWLAYNNMGMCATGLTEREAIDSLYGQVMMRAKPQIAPKVEVSKPKKKAKKAPRKAIRRK